MPDAIPATCRGRREVYGREAAAELWNNLPRKVEALPDARLDELEELAGKATEGGWCYEEAFGGFANRWAVIVRRGIHEPGFYSAIAEMVGEERTEDDAAFIAAANPAVVLALIAEVRRHRSADDFEDAVEFEARVQKRLMYQYEKVFHVKEVSGGFLPNRQTMLMFARIDAEEEMERRASNA